LQQDAQFKGLEPLLVFFSFRCSSFAVLTVEVSGE